MASKKGKNGKKRKKFTGTTNSEGPKRKRRAGGGRKSDADKKTALARIMANQANITTMLSALNTSDNVMNVIPPPGVDVSGNLS